MLINIIILIYTEYYQINFIRLLKQSLVHTNTEIDQKYKKKTVLNQKKTQQLKLDKLYTFLKCKVLHFFFSSHFCKLKLDKLPDATRQAAGIVLPRPFPREGDARGGGGVAQGARHFTDLQPANAGNRSGGSETELEAPDTPGGQFQDLPLLLHRTKRGLRRGFGLGVFAHCLSRVCLRHVADRHGEMGYVEGFAVLVTHMQRDVCGRVHEHTGRPKGRPDLQARPLGAHPHPERRGASQGRRPRLGRPGRRPQQRYVGRLRGRKKII